MMFLDELFDLWRNRCPIEAHHEQLTLDDTLLASPLAACSQMRPTIALHYSNVSRIHMVTLRIVWMGAVAMLTYRGCPRRDQPSRFSP